ncbi:MAG: hypothetical protein EBU15_06160 [Betaproteobacteria bacterium]|nr:hypothetical protein [Betaproteobacteria bacterium]
MLSRQLWLSFSLSTLIQLFLAGAVAAVVAVVAAGDGVAVVAAGDGVATVGSASVSDAPGCAFAADFATFDVFVGLAGASAFFAITSVSRLATLGGSSEGFAASEAFFAPPDRVWGLAAVCWAWVASTCCASGTCPSTELAFAFLALLTAGFASATRVLAFGAGTASGDACAAFSDCVAVVFAAFAARVALTACDALIGSC